MRIDFLPLSKRGTALAATAAALVMMTANASADANADTAGVHGARGSETRQIASSVLGHDVKFTLTAVRSTADPLAATVRLKAFAQRDGVWALSDQILVGDVDGWFWFPLTGSGAVCEFSTAGTDPAPVAVSLLITPSIGCSPTERFQLRDGQFAAEGSSVRKLHGGVSAGGGGMAGVIAAEPGQRRG